MTIYIFFKVIILILFSNNSHGFDFDYEYHGKGATARKTSGSGKEKIVEHDIKSIKEAVWLTRAGTNKGHHHDRQDLGFILSKNTVLKIRQINTKFTKKIILRLLSQDSHDEKSLKVGSDWVQIEAPVSLVPFVDTPYGNQDAKIEYQIRGNIQPKPLATFRKNGNNTAFFKIWDDFDGDFALIKGKQFQLFIPNKDKELVRNLKDFSSLDELIDHYEEIFNYYNKMIGLDNSAPENKQSKNRYFLKADAHGAGAAYYSDNWTANSQSTVDMWLTKNNWGVLHEIAHGYQASFIDQGINTREVLNNLFGVQYQYEKFGKKADQIGWLFDYGKKALKDSEMYVNIIKNRKDFNHANHRVKLILLTMLKQKAGDDAFTTMYRDYRKIANQKEFKKENYPFPDLMNKHYSENSGLDFSAPLQKRNIHINPVQAEVNRYKNYEAVASLVDIVPEEQLDSARKIIDDNILINSNFEIVRNSEVAPLGIKGNLTLQLTGQHLDLLMGEIIQLKEGSRIVRKALIKDSTVEFTDVPIGVYTLAYPKNFAKGNIVNEYYVYVKEKQNRALVTFKAIKSSALFNQYIQLLGIGNNAVGYISTELNNHQGEFAITTNVPHNYYSTKTYIQIQVNDEKQKVVFQKEVRGIIGNTFKIKFPLKIGYKIKLFHDETSSRVVSSENLINIKSNTNTFIMTKWGLQNTALQKNAEENLIKKINQQAKVFLNNPVFKNSVSINQLQFAIFSLNEPYRGDACTLGHPIPWDKLKYLKLFD